MAYEGDELSAGNSIIVGLMFSDVECVLVSGTGPNIYGHALVHCLGGSDAYFHVVGDVDSPGWKYLVSPLWGLGSQLLGKPRHMNSAGYARYLSETGKTEWGRISGHLTAPPGAVDYLKRRVLETWFWGAVAHNCVSFVREVITAGTGAQPGGGDLPRNVARAAGIPV